MAGCIGFGAVEQGASDEQALAYGTISGAAEVLTEMIPVDELMKMGPLADWRGFFADIVKLGGEEFLGEGTSSAITKLTDYLALGDKSSYEARKRWYQEEKQLSREAAAKAAFLDEVKEVLFDAFGGFASGSISASAAVGGETAKQYVQKTAKVTDAEGYAKLLQEIMPEFAAENGWNIAQAVPMQKAKEYMDSKRTNSPVAKSLINDRMNSNGWKNRGIQFFAKIPEGKFLQYALNPEKSPDKARAFQAALGYDLNNYSELIQNIAEHTDESKFVEKGDIGYGMRYEFVMNLTGANGKNANVLTAWVQDGDEKRLTSVYITKKKVTE